MSIRNLLAGGVLCSLLFLCGWVPAAGGVHLWRVKEVFSNADGTIQFVEIATCCSSTMENLLSGQHLRSASGGDFIFPGNVAGSTLNKHVLLATDGFTALPGAPPRDHRIPNNFFSINGDAISFATYDTFIFTAGQLPTNGSRSLNKNPEDTTDVVFEDVNSPTNYAGQTGSVNAITGPPGVPDGTGGTTPMTAAAATPDASTLRISYDVASCTNAADHHIVYGRRSGFPGAPGGIYTPMGSVCGIGRTSPYDWVDVPDAADGIGLIWFLVVATDASGVEGSLGVDGGGNEINGPGNGGASGTCALVKNVANTCGHTSP